jgi:hypothetical protein
MVNTNILPTNTHTCMKNKTVSKNQYFFLWLTHEGVILLKDNFHYRARTTSPNTVHIINREGLQTDRWR